MVPRDRTKISRWKFLGGRFWLRIHCLGMKQVALCGGEPSEVFKLTSGSPLEGFLMLGGRLGRKSPRSPLSPTYESVSL